jgi:FSR family fosmidomycin resistance protein-like MFS transporter
MKGRRSAFPRLAISLGGLRKPQDVPENAMPDAMPAPSHQRRTLLTAGLAHVLHDGYTDLIYILLPLWQSEFALSYGMLAFMRGLYTGAMAALQVPAGRLAERVDGRVILALGTAVAGVGYALAGVSGGLLGLAVGLIISGAGSATQHPIASSAVARAYQAAPRAALGIYNFTGDVGKAAVPAATALALTVLPWREVLWLLALLGVLVAGVLALVMPAMGQRAAAHARPEHSGSGQGRGFALLFAIGVLDTGVRMGLLTFLPFLLQAKGAAMASIGLAFALVFIGGAGGKFLCGWLGQRLGLLASVTLTEAATALGIFALLFSPLGVSFVLLPVLGIALNGTSSVLYGTVPEVSSPERTERAFALFYTGVIGSGAISPVLYGMLGDAAGVNFAVATTALAALSTIPLAFALVGRLHRGLAAPS